jgi:endothelin-converting enzyme/putative endopeptidase
MSDRVRRILIAFVVVSLPLAGALGRTHQTAGQAPAPPSRASGLDLTALNGSVSPCTDFYEFACGSWIKNNPIPADRARWGRFDELQERNNEVLRRILEMAASAGDGESKKIGDYYASCMDEGTIERRGRAALDADFTRIASLERVGDLPGLLAALHTNGVGAFFGFGAEADFKDATTVLAILVQGGMGLPDRDYYFREDTRSVEIRKQYVQHVANIAALSAGEAPGAATTRDAETVMRIETALAQAALDVVAQRDPAKVYHKMTPAELQALAPAFDWSEYFRRVGAPTITALNVTEPDFFKAFSQLLTTTVLDDLKTYLRWHVAHASAFILSSSFVNEDFQFYQKALRGVPELRPRWKRCVQYTDSDLGEALGKAFVEVAFGPKAKADMLEMVRALERALEDDIKSLPWMTPDTKAQALAKLHAISNKIGYPDKWRDYGPLEISRDDAAGNSQRANAFEHRRQMNKIGKPLDKTEWSMTPPTVNAYYNPLENNINFPAGILQPPFYSANADPGVNFGGAGAVIGHELTHGFDDQGRQFDANGNLTDWWTAEDAKAFEKRAACFVEQYQAYSPVPDVKLNGELTLGENTADNGGLRIALLAYLASGGRSAQTLDGFTPEQRVFLGWGQVWCESRRPEYERLQAQTNPHSPGRYRVNGVVSNMPEFQKAFSCPTDAPMVRAAQCRVW